MSTTLVVAGGAGYVGVGVVYARLVAKRMWRNTAQDAGERGWDEIYARKRHNSALRFAIVAWWACILIQAFGWLGRWVRGPVERERREIAELRRQAAHWRGLAADPALATSEAARADLETVAAGYDQQANERAVALGVVPTTPEQNLKIARQVAEDRERQLAAAEQVWRAERAEKSQARKLKLAAKHMPGCRCSICADLKK